MPVWRTIPVEQQPTLTLKSWRVYNTIVDGWHLVGRCVENDEGRVSSAVKTFDPATGRAVTRTSRVYQLSGPPGHDMDAEYAWNVWARLNNEMGAKDVTNQAWDAIRAKKSAHDNAI